MQRFSPELPAAAGEQFSEPKIRAEGITHQYVHVSGGAANMQSCEEDFLKARQQLLAELGLE